MKFVSRVQLTVLQHGLNNGFAVGSAFDQILPFVFNITNEAVS